MFDRLARLGRVRPLRDVHTYTLIYTPMDDEHKKEGEHAAPEIEKEEVVAPVTPDTHGHSSDHEGK